MQPFFRQIIAPELRRGKKVLIAAHGNSLRALVKILDNVPEDKIVGLNIPTGVPLVYRLNRNLKPVGALKASNTGRLRWSCPAMRISSAAPIWAIPIGSRGRSMALRTRPCLLRAFCSNVRPRGGDDSS